MKEIFDIAAKKGIMLPQFIIEDTFKKAKGFPYDTGKVITY